MTIRILYYSKGRNTQKVAEAIAQAVQEKAEAVPPAYPADNVRLLFLGSGVYGGKMGKPMAEYIELLSSARVQNVALFGTSGRGGDAAIRQMRQILTGKGIHVLDESFVCRGQFAFFASRNHPDGNDLKAAQEFAKKAVESLKE